MEPWQYFALIPIVLTGIMLVTLVLTALFDYKMSANDRENKRRLKQNPGLLKSEAFCQGFRDMAEAFNSVSCRQWYSMEFSYDFFNNPSLDSTSMQKMGQEAFKMKDNFNLALGQTSEKYLGGTDEEFKDYYLGGMYFMSKLDEAKAKAVEKRDADKRRKAIIEARRKGLKDVNTKITEDMRELDALRNKTFSTEEFEKNWDRQLKEISNGIL